VEKKGHNRKIRKNVSSIYIRALTNNVIVKTNSCSFEVWYYIEHTAVVHVVLWCIRSRHRPVLITAHWETCPSCPQRHLSVKHFLFPFMLIIKMKATIRKEDDRRGLCTWHGTESVAHTHISRVDMTWSTVTNCNWTGTRIAGRAFKHTEFVTLWSQIRIQIKI